MLFCWRLQKKCPQVDLKKICLFVSLKNLFVLA